MDLCAACDAALESGSPCDAAKDYVEHVFLHIPDSSLCEGVEDDDDGEDKCVTCGVTSPMEPSLGTGFQLFSTPSRQ